MAYSDKTEFSAWPHNPASGQTVTAGTTSPKAGWLGNLELIKEWIAWAWGALRGDTGHTHTGVDGDGPILPVSAITPGTDGQVLTTNGSGDVAWAANAAMTNPMTTAGDLIVGGTAGAAARLAKGTDGQVLLMSSGSVAWGTPTDPTKTVGMEHTWTIPNEVVAASGDVDYILPFFVYLRSGETAKLVKARHRINSGTSATVKLTKNGSDITGFTGISVTTTSGETDPADVDLADNDLIALVVTGVSGTPKNLTFTLCIDKTQ